MAASPIFYHIAGVALSSVRGRELFYSDFYDNTILYLTHSFVYIFVCEASTRSLGTKAAVPTRALRQLRNSYISSCFLGDQM